MNKKVLGTALLAGLAIGMSSAAFAQTAEVKYEKLSTFTLNIPSQTTNISAAGGTMDVGVSAWNIANGKTLKVSIGDTAANPALSPSGVLQLTNTNNAAHTVTTQMTHASANAVPEKELFTIAGPAFNNTHGVVTTERLTMGALNETNPQAGTYTATLTFVGEVN